MQPLQTPSGSSVDRYTRAPRGIIDVPFGKCRFWTISSALIFTSCHVHVGMVMMVAVVCVCIGGGGGG